MKNRGEEASTQPNKTAKDAPESPYLAARREWNERYGSYIVRANHWRLVAFASVAIAAIAVTGLVVVSAQHKVVPFLIETDEHGVPMYARRADVAQKPNEHQLRAALRQWMIGARTVYTDLSAQKSIVDYTYAMTLPNSAAFQRLAEFHGANNPYRRARDKDEIVEIDVYLVSMLSTDSWLLEWSETIRQRGGTVISHRNWQATLMVAISPPSSPEQIEANPLGLYVHQLSWSPRL